MSATTPHTHFAHGFSGEPDCVMPLVRMLLANGVPVTRMGLIRWDRLRPLLDQRWGEVANGLFKLVHAQSRELLGADAVCLRFDDTSALLVAHDDASARDRVAAVAAAVRRTLFGPLGRDELVEVWAVEAVDEAGLVCRRGDDGAAPARPASASVHHSLVLSDTDFSYLPLWEVRRNFVYFYACEPFWTLPDGTTARENDVAGQFAAPHHRAALDGALLRNVAAVLGDVVEHDRMAQVLVPVHYSTLTGAGSAQYLAELHQNAFEMKERAYLEIVGLPSDTAPHRLNEIVDSLHGVCRGICVRVDGTTPSLTALAGAKVFAVGLNLRGDARPEADIIADLEGFAARAAAADLRAYAYGIRTTSLGVAAACSGVDFLGTDSLSAALDGCVLDDYVLKAIDLYTRIVHSNC